MHFEVERVDRLLKDLKKLSFRDQIDIETFQFKEGKYRTYQLAQNDRDWQAFQCGVDKWGDPDKRYWFSQTVTIPKNFSEKEVWFCLKTGQEDQWDLNKNPQFLLYLNDEIIQGFDINHTSTRLFKAAEADHSFRIDLAAYSGFEPHHVEFIPSICVFDRNTDEMYFHAHVILEIAKRLNENDIKRIKLLNVLNEAMNIIDFRLPYSDTYYSSLEDAKNYIEEHVYNDKTNNENYQVSCVGHTHIDVAWLWDLEQTREKVVRSFSTVLNLMKDYPEYKFMSSQPQLYEFLKEEAPELYKEVKNQVKSGNWEPEGAMWVEADCNLISGESLIRQILLGTRFFKKEFNVENEILWLPDVFGYSQALPQILKGFNIKYFMTTKISWNEYNKMPYDTFMWQGIDGSEVLTHFVSATDFEKENKINTFTTYNGMIDANHTMGAWQRYQQKSINEDVLICYGYGDGGGGPTREMLEISRRMKKGVQGAPKVELTHSKPYFNKLEKTVRDQKKLPKWIGELYLEYHRGTYTSMAKSKRYNRKSEQLIHDIEVFGSFAELVDVDFRYPKEKLDDLWKLVLLNQFHDILPGTSIKKVYDDSFKQYEEIETVGQCLLEEALDAILRNSGGHELVLFNQLGKYRDDYIEIPIEDATMLKNGSETYYIQKINSDKGLVYVQDIPSYGFMSFEKCVEDVSVSSSFKFSSNKLETPYYQVEFDNKGHMVSLFDKEFNREILVSDGNVFQVFEDKPHHYDAWDINIYYKEKKWIIDDLVSFAVVENGPLRFGLKIVKKYLESSISQIIYFYHKSRRIDFETVIDWHQKHALLKVAFPVDINTEKATYDIQFGHVERPTHQSTSWDFAKFEVVGHKWADISEGDYGVSLLNDCKYGYDIQEGVMRLSLIKSATEPNPEADQGEHLLTYSVFPHNTNGKLETIKEGYKLNNPMYAIAGLGEKSDVLSKTLVQVDKENIVIDVFKKAEDKEGYIIRIHDQLNMRSSFTLTFMNEVSHAYACDLHEQEIRKTKYNVNKIDDLIKPFEIKTYYVEFKE